MPVAPIHAYLLPRCKHRYIWLLTSALSGPLGQQITRKWIWAGERRPSAQARSRQGLERRGVGTQREGEPMESFLGSGGLTRHRLGRGALSTAAVVSAEVADHLRNPLVPGSAEVSCPPYAGGSRVIGRG
jgi:hypothetical protein